MVSTDWSAEIYPVEQDRPVPVRALATFIWQAEPSHDAAPAAPRRFDEMSMPVVVRVFIATTQGSVEIEHIIDLSPGIKSCVAVKGSADSIELKPSYHAFIRKGSGIIARCFGHEAFRLELSDAIHKGSSWQLGVFIAHALHYQNQLAEAGEAPTTTVWATGTVDYGFRVGEITSLKEKIEHLKSSLTTEPQANPIDHAIWPKANGAEVSPSDRDTLARLGVTIHEVDDARDVLAILGLDPVQEDGSARIQTAADTASPATPGLSAQLHSNGPGLVAALWRGGAWLGAFAIEMLILYGLRSSAPPWPKGTIVATGAVVALALIGTSLFGQRGTLRTSPKGAWLMTLLTGSLFFIYFYAASYFIIVDTESRNEQHPAVVGGFVCQDLIEEYYASQKVKCPWLVMDQLRQDGYNPERFWTPQSIYQARMILLLSWFGSFISLSTLAGRLLSEFNSSTRETNRT